MKPKPIACCIPVSWPTGLGELMRQVNLGQAARSRWPDLELHFVVNRNIPAAARARIPDRANLHLLDTSPTLDDEGVCRVLERCQPDLALFDNSGGPIQWRAARRVGARTVFLSTRRESRSKALGFAGLRWLDEHWIVEPATNGEILSAWARLEFALAPGARVRRFDSIFVPFDSERAIPLAQSLVSRPGSSASNSQGQSRIRARTESVSKGRSQGARPRHGRRHAEGAQRCERPLDTIECRRTFGTGH